MRCLMFAVVITLVCSSQGGAQPRGYDAVFGVGLTGHSERLWRGAAAAPLVRVGVQSRPSQSAVDYRFDAEFMRVSGSRRINGVLQQTGGTALSVNYAALVSSRTGDWRPYMLAGVGLQGLSSRAPDSWPGVFGAVRAGVGVTRHVGARVFTAELAMAGAMRAFGETRHFPMTVGMLF